MAKCKKLTIAANLILILWICVGSVFYLKQYDIVLKSLLSAGFALMGIINMIYALSTGSKNKKYHVSMALALVLACVGDVVLHFDFVAGAATFALGHLGFFFAYCMLKKISATDICIGLAVFAAAGGYILLSPALSFPDGIIKFLCLAYALIISLMVGKSAGNLKKERTRLTLLAFAGSFLFCFSDIMLMLDWFGNMGRIAGILCIAAYYPAEIILAVSSLAASESQCPPSQKGTLLIDYYYAAAATVDGGGHLELTVCSQGDSQTVALDKYIKDCEDSPEIKTSFSVPMGVYEECLEIIKKHKLETWNLLKNPSCSDGEKVVCRFWNGKEHIRVSNDCMPTDGTEIMNSIRDVLQSYAKDEYSAR